MKTRVMITRSKMRMRMSEDLIAVYKSSHLCLFVQGLFRKLSSDLESAWDPSIFAHQRIFGIFIVFSFIQNSQQG